MTKPESSNRSNEQQNRAERLQMKETQHKPLIIPASPVSESFASESSRCRFAERMISIQQ